MFHCSVINVLRCLSDSFCILSCCFCFVKNFFNFFSKKFFSSFSPQATLIFYHAVLSLSRTFFIFFSKKFFQFFVSHKQLLYDTIHFSVCQQLFLLFSSFYRCVLQAVFFKLNVKDVILDI